MDDAVDDEDEGCREHGEVEVAGRGLGELDFLPKRLEMKDGPERSDAKDDEDEVNEELVEWEARVGRPREGPSAKGEGMIETGADR